MNQREYLEKKKPNYGNISVSSQSQTELNYLRFHIIEKNLKKKLSLNKEIEHNNSTCIIEIFFFHETFHKRIKVMSLFHIVLNNKQPLKSIPLYEIFQK